MSSSSSSSSSDQPCLVVFRRWYRKNIFSEGTRLVYVDAPVLYSSHRSYNADEYIRSLFVLWEQKYPGWMYDLVLPITVVHDSQCKDTSKIRAFNKDGTEVPELSCENECGTRRRKRTQCCSTGNETKLEGLCSLQ